MPSAVQKQGWRFDSSVLYVTCIFPSQKARYSIQNLIGKQTFAVRLEVLDPSLSSWDLSVLLGTFKPHVFQTGNSISGLDQFSFRALCFHLFLPSRSSSPNLLSRNEGGFDAEVVAEQHQVWKCFRGKRLWTRDGQPRKTWITVSLGQKASDLGLTMLLWQPGYQTITFI